MFLPLFARREKRVSRRRPVQLHVEALEARRLLGGVDGGGGIPPSSPPPAPSTFTVTTTGFPDSALSKTGALPTGVTFVDNGDGTATLAGTPAAGTGGTYPLTITATNTVLPDADTVERFVAAAYAQDHALGLLVETMAETAARPSQLVRITVGDLDLANPAAPKLRVPRSGKGNPKTRARKMAERVAVPISPALAARLREAADKRADDAPLLTRANGEPWCNRRNDRYRGGIATYLEVLDGQRSLYNAELTLAQARGNEYQSVVRLYNALGGGWRQ